MAPAADYTKTTWYSRYWLLIAGFMTRVLSYNYEIVERSHGKIFLDFHTHKQLSDIARIEIIHSELKFMN